MTTEPRRCLLDELAARIARIDRPHTVRVAIDGVDAAGKTTLADELVEPLLGLGRPVIRSSIDGFHNPRALRHRRGRASEEGYYRDAFDYRQLVDALLGPLGPGGSGSYRAAVFDLRRDVPIDAPLRQVAEGAVLLFDGVFLLRPELRDHWDFSIFVAAGFARTMARAESRDLELLGNRRTVRRLYRERYIPGQQLYLAECRPEECASVVVENDDPADPLLRPAATKPGA